MRLEEADLGPKQNCFLGFPIHQARNVCTECLEVRIVGRKRAACAVPRQSVVRYLKVNGEIAALVLWHNFDPQDEVVASLHIIAPLRHNRVLCRDWESA